MVFLNIYLSYLSKKKKVKSDLEFLSDLSVLDSLDFEELGLGFGGKKTGK